MSLNPTLSRRALVGGVLTIAAAPAAAHSSAFAWPQGKRAAVSLTYDDGLDSQLDYAIPQLDQAGLKATFFITREASEARVADWQSVARDGHEIEDHTDTHPCALKDYSARRFERRQLDPMEHYLNDSFGASNQRLFAFPCGFLGLGRGSRRERFGRYERLLSKRFEAARTVNGPPNDPKRVVADRLHLSAFEPTYDADDPRAAYRYLDKALRLGGWSILVFHDVLPSRRSEGDTSLRVHEQILTHIAKADLWCAPMGEAFSYIYEHPALR